MPATIENDAEVVTAESDVGAIDHVALVLDGDTCEIVALGKVIDVVSREATERDDDSIGKMYEEKEGK